MSTIYQDAMREKGIADAQGLQARSASMDGTALYDEDTKIPQFQAAKNKMNMLERPAGFVVKTGGGYVARLITPYDSDTITDEPENLPEYWECLYSKKKDKAKPWNKKTAYNAGECCKYQGDVYRSLIDNNTQSPGDAPTDWELAVDDETTTDTSTDTSKIETWDKKKTYNTGDRVKYKGDYYESTADNNTSAPDESPDTWKLIEV